LNFFPNALPQAVIVDCDYMPHYPLSYAGFVIISIDSEEEVARFYSGNPIDDYGDAKYYAHSIAARVFPSANINKFWSEVGYKDVEIA
jgi:hypothetical protein